MNFVSLSQTSASAPIVEFKAEVTSLIKYGEDDSIIGIIKLEHPIEVSFAMCTGDMYIDNDDTVVYPKAGDDVGGFGALPEITFKYGDTVRHLGFAISEDETIVYSNL